MNANDPFNSIYNNIYEIFPLQMIICWFATNAIVWSFVFQEKWWNQSILIGKKGGLVVKQRKIAVIYDKQRSI